MTRQSGRIQQSLAQLGEVVGDRFPHNGIQGNGAAIGQKDQWRVLFVGLLFFLGGLARLLAWVATGTPNWFYLAMIPVELVIPVINWRLLTGVRRSTPAEPEPGLARR